MQLRCPRVWGTLLLAALFLLSNTVEASGGGPEVNEASGAGAWPLKGTFYRKGKMGMYRLRYYNITETGMLTYTDKGTMGAGVEFDGSLSLGETSIKYNEKKTTQDRKFLGRFGVGAKYKKHEASITITQKGGGKMFGDLDETIRVSSIESDKKFVKDLKATYNHLKSQGQCVENAKACLETIGTIPANYKPSRRRRRMAQRQFSSRRDSPVNRRRRRRLNNRESPDSDTATHRRVLKQIRGY